MKTAKEWAARIQGDTKTPWEELVKMIQADALSEAECIAIKINDGHGWPVSRAIKAEIDKLKPQTQNPTTP